MLCTVTLGSNDGYTKALRLNAAVCISVFAMLYVYVVTEPIYSFNTEYVMLVTIA